MVRVAAEPRKRRRAAKDRVVFAPEDRLPAVLGVIGAARERLLLSLFRCDDFHVLDALAAAVERGVEVHVLVTPRAKGWTKRLQELWTVLEGVGATLHRYADPVVKYHAKYIVADEGPALVASLNFTRKCFTGTIDFLVTTYDPEVVDGLRRIFNADIGKLGRRRAPRCGPRLIVGPDNARRDFTRLIEGARRSIAIVDPKLTDPAILDLLKAKRDAGVEVTVLNPRHLGTLVPHGKMAIIDGSTAAIGSMSLSALSLDFRREIAIVVRDRAVVKQMRELFDRLAAGSPTSGTGSHTQARRRVARRPKP